MTTTTVSTPDTGPGPAASPPVVATPVVAPAAAERPAWLPEKFKTAEDLARSYGELEKRLGAPAAAAPAATAPAANAALTLTPAATPAVAPVTASKLLDSAYAEAEGDTKAVAAATYDALAKAGLDRTTVDTMVEGKRALFTQQKSDVHAAVGGADAYAAMAAWAIGGGFTASEMTAYNSVMSTGNPDIMKVAAAGLAHRHAAAVGSEGTLVGGVPGSVKNGEVAFKSMTEQTAAINDPRYKRDPAYRESVSRRIALS